MVAFSDVSSAAFIAVAKGNVTGACWDCMSFHDNSSPQSNVI